MKHSLNQHTLFATLSMIRSESAAPIMVVEGEDDHFALRPHTAAEVFLIFSSGRPTALGAAQLADDRGLSGVIFLLDADYDRFVQPAPYYPANVVISDSHDVMMDMIFAGTTIIDRVIDSHCRGARRSGRSSLGAEQARNAAMELATRVALLRVLNERDALGLKLADYPFGALSSPSPSAEEIALVAVNRSAVHYEAHLLAAQMTLIERTAWPATALPGDHDFFGALAWVLTHDGVSRASAAALEASYMAALSCAAIISTSWYSRIMTLPLPVTPVFCCPCAA